MKYFNIDSPTDEIYDPNQNAFHVIRLLLATMVIYSHVYPLLLGHQSPGDKLAQITSSQIDSSVIAVYGFFIISGFLTTQSILRSSYKKYILNRLFRIIPAFAIALLFCAFIVGPLVTSLPLANYFNPSSPNNPYQFFYNNIFFNVFGYAWGIRDVFENNPYVSGLNGSMWTLKHEIACYLTLIIYSFFHLLKYRLLYLVATILIGMTAILSLVANKPLLQLPELHLWVLSEYEFISFSKFLFLYMMGSLFYIFKDKIIINSRLYLLSIFILIISSQLNLINIALLILLPYIILSTCFLLKKLSFFSKFGDYSYGLYIFSFPIQQLLVFYFKDYLNIKSFFIVSVILTFAISILSWRYIESPSLKLAKWIIKKEYLGTKIHRHSAN